MLPRSLRRYLLMYSTVLLLPMAILTYFCSSQLINQFREVTYENERAVYQSEVVAIEHRLSQMQDISFQLANKPYVLPYHISSDLDSQINMIEMLRYSLSVGDAYKDIFLLDPSGNIYTSRGTYNLDTFSGVGNLEELADAINSDQIASAGIRRIDADDENMLCFASSYPYGFVYSGGALVFQVDKRAFFSRLEMPCAVLYDGQLIAMNGDVSEGVESYLENGDTSAFNLILNSDRVQILAYQDESVSFQRFYNVQTKFMILSVALAVLSLLLITFFSYRSYQPMKKLKTAMLRLGVGESEQGEIDVSIATMEQLSRQSREMGLRLAAEQYIVREMWLSKLVNRQYSDVEIDVIVESLKEHGVMLESNLYAVCVFRCARPLPKEMYPDTEGSVLRWHFFHDSDNRLIGLICGESLARILVEEAVAQVMRQFSLQEREVECFIGSVCDRVEDINLSYIQALSIVRYGSLKNGKVSFYSGPMRAGPAFSYPQDELNRLSVVLSGKDIPAAVILLSSISARVSGEGFGFSFSKTIAYAVVNALIKGLVADEGDIGERVPQYLFLLEQAYCKDDVIRLFQQISSDLEKRGVLPSKEKGSDRMQKCLSYIDAHYTDTNFYVGQAAEFCGLSPNNFSQQFKHQFGISPVKYLTSIRIERAKKLLVETQLPVNEIAAQSGFSDISSFQRNFKNSVSATPTQYRAAHIKEK